MKIRYDNVSKKFTGLDTPDWIVSDDTQTVVDIGNVQAPSDPINWYTFGTLDSPFVRMNQDDIDKLVAVAKFNINILSAGLAEVFDLPTQVQLAPQFSVLAGYAQAKVFGGAKSVKTYLAQLVTSSIITTDQQTAIYSVFAFQGIDLTKF